MGRKTAVEVARLHGLVLASVTLLDASSVVLDADARHRAVFPGSWVEPDDVTETPCNLLDTPDLPGEASHSASMWVMLRPRAPGHPRRGCSSCLLLEAVLQEHMFHASELLRRKA